MYSSNQAKMHALVGIHSCWSDFYFFCGHRMIKIVGALIGALAGLIVTDFLFQAMPTLLEYENEVKIGLVIFGAILMHSMLLVAMRSVAGLGVFVAFSSLVLALQEEGMLLSKIIQIF